MKSALELNKLLFKFALLYHVDIQETSREDNVKFNLQRITWESKTSWRVYLSSIQRAWNTKFCQTWCHLRDKVDLLQKSHFELLGGWLHRLSHDSLLFVFCIFIYNVSTFIFYLQILDFYSNICSNSNKNFYNNNR